MMSNFGETITRRDFLRIAAVSMAAVVSPTIAATPINTLKPGVAGWVARGAPITLNGRMILPFLFPKIRMVGLGDTDPTRFVDWLGQDDHNLGPEVHLYINSSNEVKAAFRGWAHAGIRVYPNVQFIFTDDYKIHPNLLTASSGWSNPMGCHNNDPKENATIEEIAVASENEVAFPPRDLFKTIQYCYLKWDGTSSDCWDN